MDAILKPREPPAIDLEAGVPIPASRNSTTDIEAPETQAVPNLENTTTPRTPNQEYWVGEFLEFPDGETKEECLDRLSKGDKYSERRKYMLRGSKLFGISIDLT